MTTLDKICRSFLLGKGLPIHYYLQTLLYARDCLRELTFDDLHVVNYQLAKADANNEIKIPCGSADVVGVGIRVGQSIRPLVHDDKLNNLADYDSNGKQIPYLSDSTLSGVNTTNTGFGNTLSGIGWAYNSFNDFGEYLGRDFGYNATYNDTYKVIRERGVIKINEYIQADNYVLQTISDGTNCNAATQVDPYAIATITAYIEWYRDENGKFGTPGQAKFNRERQTLRGRKSNLTLDGIKRAMQQAYGSR